MNIEEFKNIYTDVVEEHGFEETIKKVTKNGTAFMNYMIGKGFVSSLVMLEWFALSNRSADTSVYLAVKKLEAELSQEVLIDALINYLFVIDIYRNRLLEMGVK